MTARFRFLPGLLAAGLMALQTGCMPSSQGQDDEQKESFYLKGKALESTLDFKGAIEAYEKAIEVNPQNGSAHFELGLLSEKESNYAAAIYHFERYLKLRPDSERMQIVKDRIMQNKMELAKTTTYAPLTQNTQKQFDALNDEIRQLRAENEKLKADVAAAQARATVADSTAAQLSSRQPRTEAPPIPQPGGTTRAPADADPRPATRTYTVKAGDTPTSIAKKFNVKLDNLIAINPGLDPKKMKVGQSLKIPSA